MMEVALPGSGDADALSAALDGVAREQGVDVSLRPLEQETL
jgi:hypothetical protein